MGGPVGRAESLADFFRVAAVIAGVCARIYLCLIYKDQRCVDRTSTLLDAPQLLGRIRAIAVGSVQKSGDVQ